MIKKVAFHFCMILVFLINSCSGSNSNKKLEKEKEVLETTIVSAKANSIQIDLDSEKRYAYLTEIIKSAGNLFIKVDYVDYLTGKEAMEAEWRDKAYFVDGKDTTSMITDGYYISNINTKIRTFKIGRNAKIENIIDDDGPQKMNPPKNFDLEQLNTYKEQKTLLFLHVTEGIIKRIDERFFP